MKIIEPIEVETCCNCGEQCNKGRMHPMNVGKRIEWLCPGCYAGGIREVESRRIVWAARKLTQKNSKPAGQGRKK